MPLTIFLRKRAKLLAKYTFREPEKKNLFKIAIIMNVGNSFMVLTRNIFCI